MASDSRKPLRPALLPVAVAARLCNLIIDVPPVGLPYERLNDARSHAVADKTCLVGLGEMKDRLITATESFQ